ncbi:hypothetical protein AMTR_s00058p00150340 [Amborella trichopoda]|uniref:MalT-like TPR region domain-containing protein n=1 Tax=Amborella trichopoda TaxID=13333 RepID=W1PG28_AMBTC|nr:hypothetical protein AMTR_s00058p00150340 [Amborella trichopoda]
MASKTSPDPNTPSPAKSKPSPSKKSSISPSSQQKKRLSLTAVEHEEELGLDNPDLGPFLLKLARDLIASGDNPSKALDCAARAARSFELCNAESPSPSLDLVMALHVLAAIHCGLGQFAEAVPILERSISIPDPNLGPDHALAAFSGHMQLGDTYAMLGSQDLAIKSYTLGLAVQKEALGDTDPRVAETCRYLAEAQAQIMQLPAAAELVKHCLAIHKEHSAPASAEEASDRRLMALICEAMGDHEAALEHLVLASVAAAANGFDEEVAAIDVSIGDSYLGMGRYDESVFAYQKALTVFKAARGENHLSVGTVMVRLADLYQRTGKMREGRSYCESALRVYAKPVPGTATEDVAAGLAEVAAVYEAMGDLDESVKLLQKAVRMMDGSVAPGRQGQVAGIEAQMGVVYYMVGRYGDAYDTFKVVVAKMRAGGEAGSAFFGVVLNQMGLTCVQRFEIKEAVELFAEAKVILEKECGAFHPDTLGVYSNLAAAYDAMGSPAGAYNCSTDLGKWELLDGCLFEIKSSLSNHLYRTRSLMS